MKLLIAPMLLAFSFGTASAQEETTTLTTQTQKFLAKSTVGVGFNIVDADRLGGTVIGFGAIGDYRLGEQLSAGLTADYWRKTSGTLAAEQVSISDLSVGVNTKYHFQIEDNSRLTPFAGIGVALHRFSVKYSEKNADSGEVVDPYETKSQDVEGEFGADFLGGVAYGIAQNLDLGAQIRFRNILDADVGLDQLVIDGSLLYKL